MTQCDLELEPRTKVPENKFSQLYILLAALKNGERLTVKVAMERYGVYALSQRMGELRRQYGWPIQSITREVHPRVFVSEYFLAE